MNLLFLFLALFTIASVVFGNVNLRRREDSEVAICDQFDICNLVYNPYWGFNSVEKICKCPGETFCPATFSQNDGFSLAVNRRTQMKFCSPIEELQAELETCDDEEVAIKVRTVYHIDQVKNVSASILCNCDYDAPTYWKFHSRLGKIVADDEKLFEVVDNFKCSGEKSSTQIIATFDDENLPELKKCNANEFCGFARIDYGFVFQRCSCDTIHDCSYFAEESEVEEDIESELFYSGLMYKSRCVRNESHDHW